MEREFFAARPIKPDLGVLGRKWAPIILADVGLRRVDHFQRPTSFEPSAQLQNPEQETRGARGSRHDSKSGKDTSAGTGPVGHD